MKKLIFVLFICLLFILNINNNIKADDLIPSNYVRLEYIESDSKNQFINTDYYINQNSIIKCECLINTNQSNDFACAFGTRGDNSLGVIGDVVEFYPLYIISDQAYYHFDYYYSLNDENHSNEKSNDDYPYDEKSLITLDVKNRSLSVVSDDGNSYNLYATNHYPTAISPLFIFDSSYVNDEIVYNTQSNCQMRLYRFTILEGDKLIKDFIPVYDKTTKKNGLFEIVSKQFFTDSNIHHSNFIQNYDMDLIEGFSATVDVDGLKNCYYSKVTSLYYEDILGNILIGDESKYNDWKENNGKILKHNHIYNNSICSYCGYECPHENIVSDKCVECEKSFEKSLAIKFANLAFEANTYILIAVKGENLTETPKLRAWTIGDGKYLPTDDDCQVLNPIVSNYLKIDGTPYYLYEYTSLGAKQMTDYVYFEAYSADVKSDIFKYSIQAYITNIFDSYPKFIEDYSKEQIAFKSLITKMIEYGREAQKYYNYNLDNLPGFDYVRVNLLNNVFRDNTTYQYVKLHDSILLDMPDGCDNFIHHFAGDYSYGYSDRLIEIVEPMTIEAVKSTEENAIYISVDVNNKEWGKLYRDPDYEHEVYNVRLDLNRDYSDKTIHQNKNSVNFYPYEALSVGGSAFFLPKAINDDYVFLYWDIEEDVITDHNLHATAIFGKKVEAYISLDYTQSVGLLYAGEKRNSNDIELDIWKHCDNESFPDYKFWGKNSYLMNFNTLYIDSSMKNVIGYKDYMFMFKQMSNLEFVYGLENLDMSWTTSLNRMFYGTKLKYLDLSSWDISNVTSFDFLFSSSSWLETIDLTGWDIHCDDPEHNDKGLDCMFSECRSLNTIYCDHDWTSASSNQYLFGHSDHIMGGCGTTYVKSTYEDGIFARPDDPANGKPGYFTIKNY